MSNIQLLRAASTLHDVAHLLNYQPKSLAYIIYKMPNATKYKTFKMAKRNGGFREINAPCPELKLLQRRLSDLLQNCIGEINTRRKFPDQLAHGFKRGHSIISNAAKHHKRKYVFNIDLEDFFGKINFGRVRGFLIKDANFLLDSAVATVLAQIACHQNGLPQGSPCSPVFSNLVGHVLDIQLCRLASTHGCTYSRYADDITFSTNKPDFPAAIARLISTGVHEWEAGPELQRIIAKEGFTINNQKTRMQYKGSRQDVTGLVVNKKVNVRTEFRRNVRAMAQRLFITGQFQFFQSIPDANGVLTPTAVNGTVEQLQGLIGHIDRLDCHNEALVGKRKNVSMKEKDAARAALSSKQQLYKRFLLFKDFYSAQRPIVVCEGKTDNIYLLHAIKALAAKYPKLASVGLNSKPKLNIRILRTFESSAGRILHLAQGASAIHGLIENYMQELKKFKAPGLDSAIILLLDNDSGANTILKLIAKVTGKTPSRMDPYIHVAGNMYVVLTPLNGATKESEIEDSFDDAVLKVNLGGKSFNSSSKPDSNLHFGKHILSQYVRDNATKINFAGFAPILERITAAIEDYETGKMNPPILAGTIAQK